MYFWIKNKIKHVLSTPIIKNITLITGGTAVAQILNIVSSPIISRLYTPDEYGVLSVFSSILLIFSFSSLKYEMAIPIVKKRNDAVDLLVLSIAILFTVSSIVGIALYIFKNRLLNIFDAEILEPFLIFIPVGIFLNGLYMIFKYWMYRMKKFKDVSKTSMVQSLTGNLTKIFLGFFKFGGIGLILGRIASTSSGTLGFYKRSTLKKNDFKSLDVQNVRKNARKFIDFPLFQATSTAVVHLRNQFPIIFLTPLYGTGVVGLFGMANSIVKLPMNIVGSSVMEVFYSEVASLGEENAKEIKGLSNGLFKQLLVIGAIPTIILLIFGPDLFEFVFGSYWRESGVYAQILSISIYSNFVFSPISKIFEVFKEQKIKFVIDGVSVIIIVSIFVIGGYLSFNPRVIISVYSICMGLIYFVTYLISRLILNSRIDT